MATHQCYSCDKVVSVTDLKYECMCYSETPPHYRGVCWDCDVLLPEKNPGPDHHLRRRHKPSPEYTAWCEESRKMLPEWNGMIDGGDCIILIGYKDGQRVEVKVPLPPARQCTCCENGFGTSNDCTVM